MRISVSHKGDLSKTVSFLNKAKGKSIVSTLERFGAEGVAALSAATPVESGKTSSSWSYEIQSGNGYHKLIFLNSNINKGANIAILLQYGHGTRNGGYVQGRDYINPAIRPIFDKIAEFAWKEVTE